MALDFHISSRGLDDDIVHVTIYNTIALVDIASRISNDVEQYCLLLA